MTYRYRSGQTGLTLIELMISLVLGLIVVGATIALAVSLMRSNNETIRSTRLTQELRAAADVVTTEIRRARSLSDPLANVGQGAAAFTTCNAIYPAATDGVQSCILFAYECNPQNGSGTYHMIRRNGAALEMSAGNTALTCASAGNRLNSPELAITTANFSTTAEGAIQFTLEGHLTSDSSVTRRVSRIVWPRSVPVSP